MPINAYRIFTNDRPKERGVPMYSALMGVNAASPEAALKQCPPQFNAPNCAPAMAIRWPKGVQFQQLSDDEKKWLRKHVGEPR